MEFKKANKKQAKLRLALFGPSGSGKTFTALRLATGLGGPIAFIDTERGSASKYADRFAFDVLELQKFNIAAYCEAINTATGGGYAVLIIDSLTHGWQELLAEVDKLARAKYRGNTWSAWSEGTPMQRKLVDAILSYPGHLIATMRTKTEWTTEKSRDGKVKPIRVGMSPQQGKGIEYEFDLLMELTTEHYCTVIKDRTGKFQDEIIEKPGEELGRSLAEWLQDGVEAGPVESGGAKAEPQPANEPAANGKKAASERPAPPATVRGWIRAKAKWVKGALDDYSDASRIPDGEQEKPNQRTKQRCAALMSDALKNAGIAGEVSAARHVSTRYLLRFASLGESCQQELNALISWLELNEGAFEANEIAAEELRRVYSAALEEEEASQLPLLLDEAQQ